MDGKESEESMRIPELDFDMDIEGLVTVSQDGDIELLPCPLTELITAETHLIFDAFYICPSFQRFAGRLLCEYTAFEDTEPLAYKVYFSNLEWALINSI